MGKFIIEMLPLIVFFITYKYQGIIFATLMMLVSVIVISILTYIKDGKLNKMNIISIIVLLISGGLTVFSGKSEFIKMKPTALYTIFALIFCFSHFTKSPAVKYLFGGKVIFNNLKSIRNLNLRFIFFFLSIAILNEYIWRNYSENTWVNFKIWGVLPITILFFVTQIPFLVKNAIISNKK
jgi:intracellular septation protein